MKKVIIHCSKFILYKLYIWKMFFTYILNMGFCLKPKQEQNNNDCNSYIDRIINL